MTKLSFEFFPPKTLEASFRLWDCVTTLAPFDPAFVSVTYGAGGTTRKLTQEAVTAIHRTTGLPVAAHLTCVAASRSETLSLAEAFGSVGVRDIVALRGDPPKDTGSFVPHPDGFQSSVELIAALADEGRYRLHVGCYPEVHPEAVSADADIAWLKAKVDAGASTALSQFFFDAEVFLRYRDRCAAAGIDAPIVPGILPIENWAGVQRFAASCGTAIPSVIRDAFDRATPGQEADLLATAVAAELCDALISEGVEHLHFYTLNKPALTRDVLRALGHQPRADLKDVA